MLGPLSQTEIARRDGLLSLSDDTSLDRLAVMYGIPRPWWINVKHWRRAIRWVVFGRRGLMSTLRGFLTDALASGNLQVSASPKGVESLSYGDFTDIKLTKLRLDFSDNTMPSNLVGRDLRFPAQDVAAIPQVCKVMFPGTQPEHYQGGGGIVIANGDDSAVVLYFATDEGDHTPPQVYPPSAVLVKATITNQVILAILLANPQLNGSYADAVAIVSADALNATGLFNAVAAGGHGMMTVTNTIPGAVATSQGVFSVFSDIQPMFHIQTAGSDAKSLNARLLRMVKAEYNSLNNYAEVWVCGVNTAYWSTVYDSDSQFMSTSNQLAIIMPFTLDEPSQGVEFTNAGKLDVPKDPLTGVVQRKVGAHNAKVIVRVFAGILSSELATGSYWMTDASTVREENMPLGMHMQSDESKAGDPLDTPKGQTLPDPPYMFPSTLVNMQEGVFTEALDAIMPDGCHILFDSGHPNGMDQGNMGSMTNFLVEGHPPRFYETVLQAIQADEHYIVVDAQKHLPSSQVVTQFIPSPYKQPSSTDPEI